MPKLVKMILSILFTLVFISIVGLLVSVFLVNPNVYKAKINQELSVLTGRPSVVQGDIHWTLFPWLGLQAENIKISNAPGFGSAPLATIKSIDFNLEVFPLLRGEVNIGKISLQGLELNLQKDRQGKANWVGIVNSKENSAIKKESSPQGSNKEKTVKISVSEIEVHDAVISWFDLQKNQQFIFSGISLESHNIHLQEPFEVKVSGAFKGNSDFSQGNFALNTTIVPFRKNYTFKDTVIKGVLKNKKFSNKEISFAISSSINADLQNNFYQFSNLQLAIDKLDFSGSAALKVNDSQSLIDVKLTAPSLNLTNFLHTINKQRLEKIPVVLDNFVYAGKIVLPAEGKFSLTSKISASNVQYDKVRISNLNLSMAVNNGIVRLSPITAQVYQGNYQGNVLVDMRGKLPHVNAKQTFSGINVGSLLQDFKPITHVEVTGVGNLSSQLAMIGNTREQWIRSLSGKVQFAVDKGLLKGINLEYWLAVGTALYHREPVPAKPAVNATDFGKLTGTFTVQRGIAYNNDLLLQARFIRVSGSGTTDLVNQRLDYLFKAVKMNPANNQPREDVIPIRVSGPFSHISVRPDIQELLRSQAKKELTKQANKLKEKLLGDDLKKLDFKKLLGR